MKILNQLNRDDARRIVRHLAMTGDPLGLSAVECGAQDALRHNQASCIIVEDALGKPITNQLVHLHLDWLETMSGDLRRKLLAAGHVYVELNNVRSASMQMQDGNAHGGLFTFDSDVFGGAAGIARYTKPEPDIEAMGHSDMGKRFSFHRVMPETYANETNYRELQCLDSDLRVYVDLGTIEAVAFQEVSHRKGGR
jgi:hypothetical protein